MSLTIKRVELGQQILAQAILGHVFAKDDQRLDHVGGDARGDLRQVRADRARRQCRSAWRRWLLGLRSALNKSLSASPGARNRIGQRFQLGSQFFQKIKLLVGLARRGDDGDGPGARPAENLVNGGQGAEPGGVLTRAAQFRAADCVSNGPRD